MSPLNVHAGMLTGFILCRQPQLLWVLEHSSAVMSLFFSNPNSGSYKLSKLPSSTLNAEDKGISEFFFWDGLTMYPWLVGTCYIDQAGLKLTENLPVSASIAGLKVCGNNCVFKSTSRIELGRWLQRNACCTSLRIWVWIPSTYVKVGCGSTQHLLPQH